MQPEFHATIKLITGEEIFALISVDNEEDEPIIIMQNPVTMKILSTGRGSMMKIRPWLEVPGDDVFIIKYDRIITMIKEVMKLPKRWDISLLLKMLVRNLKISLKIHKAIDHP